MLDLFNKGCITDEYLPEKGQTLALQYPEIFDKDNDGSLDQLEGEIFNHLNGRIESNSYYLNLLWILFSCFDKGDNIYINTITTLIGQYAWDIDTIKNDIRQIFGTDNQWYTYYPGHYWGSSGWDGNKWFKICTTKEMWDKAFPPQGTETMFEDTRLRVLYHLKADEDGYVYIHQTLGKRTDDNDDPYYSRSLKWTTDWFPEQSQYLYSGGHPYTEGLQKLKKEFFNADKMDAFMNWYNSYIGSGNIDENSDISDEFWTYCPSKEEIINNGANDKTENLISDNEISNITLDDINILLIEDIRYDTYKIPTLQDYSGYPVTWPNGEQWWTLNIENVYYNKCNGEDSWNNSPVYFPGEDTVYGVGIGEFQSEDGKQDSIPVQGETITPVTNVDIVQDDDDNWSFLTANPISYSIGYIISLGDLFRAKYYVQYGTGASATHELLPLLNGYYQFTESPSIAFKGNRCISLWPGEAVYNETNIFPAFYNKWNPDILLNNFKWIYKNLLNELFIQGMSIDNISYWDGAEWKNPESDYYLYEGKTPDNNSGAFAPYENNQLVKIVDIREK